MMRLDGVAQIHGCTDVGRTIEELFARLQAEGNDACHECSALLWRAFAFAERSLQKPIGPIDPAREAVERAQKFVQAHLAEPLALGDMARAARLSPFHFARTFRRITGFTPAAYIRSLRMSRAQELLRQGGRSVKEVGAAVGYPVVQHFSTAFQQSTGMRPTQFTQLHGV
jgi:transcriptional regulator GlxA family with amidase domain